MKKKTKTHNTCKIIKLKYLCFFGLIFFYEFKIHKIIYQNKNQKNLKIALCTMGKKENLYIREYIDYYLKLGVDHLFIYDNNSPNTEKIIDCIESSYKNKVSVYETNSKNITNQATAFTDCYQNHKYEYDWFLMLDIDEYLFIVNDSLKNYLNRSIFDKCDIINFHWALATDNNLVYYDKRTLFERFKGPYVNSIFVKSIIRGNITNLTYAVHSPKISPERNITCDNEGKRLNYSILEIEGVSPISVKKAYIIHFRYKSTEEFINKYKRGYNNWFGNRIKYFLDGQIREYFDINNITMEKINFLEKELNLNLSVYKNKISLKKI